MVPMRTQANLESLAGLTRACARCGVLHSVTYLCASERKLARTAILRGHVYSESTVAVTRILPTEGR